MPPIIKVSLPVTLGCPHESILPTTVTLIPPIINVWSPWVVTAEQCEGTLGQGGCGETGVPTGLTGLPSTINVGSPRSVAPPAEFTSPNLTTFGI